jgi:recombinational DNA repair protein (RecF pathway)
LSKPQTTTALLPKCCRPKQKDEAVLNSWQSGRILCNASFAANSHNRNHSKLPSVLNQLKALTQNDYAAILTQVAS